MNTRHYVGMTARAFGYPREYLFTSSSLECAQQNFRERYKGNLTFHQSQSEEHEYDVFNDESLIGHIIEARN